jgi:hypothetical protein
MRNLPRRPTTGLDLRVLLLACSLIATAIGCGDAATSTPASSHKSPIVPAENGTFGFQAREIPIGQKMLLGGTLVSTSTGNVLYGSLTWSSSDSAIVGFGASYDAQHGRVLGLTPGRATVTATSVGGRANIPVTVLDTTSAPSPVVVDSFYVIEFGGNGDWSYLPWFVLHDASGKGTSAVIGVSLELPGLSPSPRCAMLRPVEAQPLPLLRTGYGYPEIPVPVYPGYRVPAGAEVVAHLTLRVPGPHATELTLKGSVVPGDVPETGHLPVRDDPSCG